MEARAGALVFVNLRPGPDIRSDKSLHQPHCLGCMYIQLPDFTATKNAILPMFSGQTRQFLGEKQENKTNNLHHWKDVSVASFLA